MNNFYQPIYPNKLKSNDNTPYCNEVENNNVTSRIDIELNCTEQTNKDILNKLNPNLNIDRSQTNTCDSSNNKDNANDNINARDKVNHDIYENANDVANLTVNDNKTISVSDSNLKPIVNNNLNSSPSKINNNLESNNQMYKLIAVQLNANQPLNQIQNNYDVVHHNIKDNLLCQDKTHSINMNSGIR